MTREQANEIINRIWEGSGPTTNSLIEMFTALGMLKLEDPLDRGGLKIVEK